METQPDNAPKRPKHAALARPDVGEFSRHELAILGAPCADIQALVARLLPHLAPALRVAYVDADHAAGDAALAAGAPAGLVPAGLVPARGENGLFSVLTDKITYTQLNTSRALDKFSQPELLAHNSLVLVNGNHFRARQQIVVVDPRKPLDKKLDRLTDVRLVLLADGQTELPPVLLAHLAGAPLPLVLPLADAAGITAFVQKWYAAARPVLRGLVLAGGRSERMRTDKGALRYHGAADQRQHTAALLHEFCAGVRVSVRPDQADELPAGLVPLPDTFLGLGPLGGLLSAFRADPDAAWLVLACDLPLLTRTTLEFLVANRQPGRFATALQSPWNDFPEPLVTIWEPRAYGELLRFLSLGYSCPRKALINSDTAVLAPPVPEELRNVNTPQERAEAEAALKA
ncbi:NTP transferase domain-containing protein [Hymenobacter caeli]|uniref:Molybdopterin-guanine dinucleotide biosynthesis protein A n=1 Tax=Hymenobacter caeli TaxID=2735894 RepID=A0ABX2FQD7_9BACT|nr:NTP transferase domain-containing protein [Hymenobacter caeli]NRT18662.1 molybdopterin-guanine dinucleotide biosynthesis protein A [Hymenobacter caeli]